MKRNLCFGLALVAAICLPQASAFAATSQVPQQLTMKADMHAVAGPESAATFWGVLSLKISSDGVVNGTYLADETRPNPADPRSAVVTGGLSGNNIFINFGWPANFNVIGKLQNGRIKGTAFDDGRWFDFDAAVTPA